MVQGILIPAVDAQPPRQQSFGELEDYQRAVGGWIEAVDLPSMGATLFVNEEGLLRGLPFNRRATFIWWHCVPQARGRARLVGDAALVGAPDRSGESTGLPPVLMASLLDNECAYVVETRLPNDTRWRPGSEPHEEWIEAVVWATLLQDHVPDLRVRIRPLGAKNHPLP